MNDKCAAGTGRFLEMMARTLQMKLPEMSELGLDWHNDVTISSMCTVFAESVGRQPDCPQHRTGGYHPWPEQICCGQNRCPGPPHRRRGPLYDDRRV